MTSGHAQRARFLEPLVSGEARSAFFMTEPAGEDGAGSDPSMMKTTAVKDGDHWVINGRKTFITGADGASVGIVMAKAEEGACMFLVDLPNPAIRIERLLDTIDSSMPGGHAQVMIDWCADAIYDGPTEVHNWSLAKKIKKSEFDRIKGLS